MKPMLRYNYGFWMEFYLLRSGLGAKGITGIDVFNDTKMLSGFQAFLADWGIEGIDRASRNPPN